MSEVRCKGTSIRNGADEEIIVTQDQLQEEFRSQDLLVGGNKTTFQLRLKDSLEKNEENVYQYDLREKMM